MPAEQETEEPAADTATADPSKLLVLMLFHQLPLHTPVWNSSAIAAVELNNSSSSSSSSLILVCVSAACGCGLPSSTIFSSVQNNLRLWVTMKFFGSVILYKIPLVRIKGWGRTGTTGLTFDVDVVRSNVICLRKILPSSILGCGIFYFCCFRKIRICLWLSSVQRIMMNVSHFLFFNVHLSHHFLFFASHLLSHGPCNFSELYSLLFLKCWLRGVVKFWCLIFYYYDVLVILKEKEF